LLCCILTFTDVYMICAPFNPMQFMQHVMSALICHALICYGVPCSAITYLPMLNCAMLHAGNTKGGSIIVPLTSCLLGISCMTTDNYCFYLEKRLIQTSQTGGQQYSDTSPYSIPWYLEYWEPYWNEDYFRIDKNSCCFKILSGL